MAGQIGDFNVYALEKVPYAIDRYARETSRLHGVLGRRLAGRDFIAGDYSITRNASTEAAIGFDAAAGMT